MESDVGRIPRKGCTILFDNKPVGAVTSGGFSPSLQKPVSMGYVDVAHAKTGTDLTIEVGGKLVGARIVKKPLYKEGSHK